MLGSCEELVSGTASARISFGDTFDSTREWCGETARHPTASSFRCAFDLVATHRWVYNRSSKESLFYLSQAPGGPLWDSVSAYRSLSGVNLTLARPVRQDGCGPGRPILVSLAESG